MIRSVSLIPYRDLFVHLRLHFQILLSPVYLWGWLLAGGSLGWDQCLGYIALHVFLYGGATALNSYYDRDTGPVGGLLHPPPVSGYLLPFSLACKLIGFLIACTISPGFALAYIVFAALSVAYSHPRIRLKSSPWSSTTAIGLGQGLVVFLAGWLAERGDLSGVMSIRGTIGAMTAIFIILGLYPLTQIYQIEEDTKRGDRTLAVAIGPAKCFIWAISLQTIGGSLLAYVLAKSYSGWYAGIALAGTALQAILLTYWSRRFDERAIISNYKQVMRLSAVTGISLTVYLLWLIAIY
ncbi:UbiA prenyltransferase [Thermobaculum terrenum ATCC BAA-798]|uniref:UbiA prenyltransferase n=1 Tax=Thermobaculum terrenum (strain ATCC BAA-798 / CCMEE 7001 / YNP1) TaxID=525904 RepID=D1CBP3_THET1|nr:UbiA family prenyltransferase [Thermobaculum terrenum]ACZ42208.1 UbiA prenyltransferase [Thermobaculum terrenum ATCC BAA-798]